MSDLTIASKMPSGDVSNFIFRNKKDLSFEDVSISWGITDKSISSGAVYVDLDNDGDLDLIVNNINSKAEILENRLFQLPEFKNRSNYLKIRFKGLGNNKFGVGVRIEAYFDQNLVVQENFNSRGFQSSTAPEILLGLGEIKSVDSLKVIWPSGKSQIFNKLSVNTTLVVDELNAFEASVYPEPHKNVFFKVLDQEITGLDFIHNENSHNDFNLEPLVPHKLSQEGPALAKGDVNGDGREDIFVGGASGQPGILYVQKAEGKFEQLKQPIFEVDANLEDTYAVFFDSNQDGFLDLLVGRGGNTPISAQNLGQTKIYLNNGKGEFLSSINLPLAENTQVSIILAMDFDADGLEDLMIGGRNIAGQYGQNPRSYLLKNMGGNRFKDITKEFAPNLEYLGMIKDAAWVDLNLDGKLDLIVVGEWMPPTVFINKNGKLNNETISFGLGKLGGWWNSLAVKDFNGDGYPDLVVGNLGLNNRLKPSAEYPIQMMVKDFDQNGSFEQIISYPLFGRYFPVATKDELSKQIPKIKKDFIAYRDFAGKTTEEVFLNFQTSDAMILEAYEFKSLVLLNQEGKSFLPKQLPAEAQFSSIEAIAVEDIDLDGNFDLILGGNKTPAAPFYGPYKGSWGLLLMGEADGSFKVFNENKLTIKGDIKAIEVVSVGNKKWLVIAKNYAELEVLMITNLPATGNK